MTKTKYHDAASFQLFLGLDSRMRKYLNDLPTSMTKKSKMVVNFALRYVRIYPGVNSRAELVTLVPDLRPERFASLAWALTFKNQ